MANPARRRPPTQLSRPRRVRVVVAPNGHARAIHQILAKYRKGEDAFDGWTWVHFASGLALGLIGVKWRWALALLIGFEALEALLRRVKKQGGQGLFEYESWKNIGLDVAAGLIGYGMGRKPNPE